MNTEVTGLTLTEWMAMIGLTLFFGGWAFFDHNVLITKNYGEIDPLLLVAMLMPGAFLTLKNGETYLRAKSQGFVTNHGYYTVKSPEPQPGGEMDLIPYKGDTAVPQLKWWRCGISKPELPAITKIRCIITVEKYLVKLGGVKICMADLDRIDGDKHTGLILGIREKIDSLPGINLDCDPLLFGDTLESSWARQTVRVTNKISKRLYIVPSTPETNYDVQLERQKNEEYVEVKRMFDKLKWSTGKLKGDDFFGGQ